MEQPIIKNIDAQSARTLRLIIRARLEQIDKVYPPKKGGHDRIFAIADVHHLIHEFGMTLEDFD